MLTPKSKDRLNTCDPKLIKLIEAVATSRPVYVTCGHRNKADQDAAVKGGFSKTPFPTSKHNSLPSKAVDLAPMSPIDWKNIEAFKELGKQVKEKAQELNIKIRWGGDFTSFKDYPHFELVGEG
jgi:hypothetical protein